MTDSIPRFRTARTALLTLAAAGLLVAACDAPTPSEQPTAPGPEATTSRQVDGTAASAGGLGDPSAGPTFVPRDVDPRATNDGEITRLLKVHAARIQQRQPGTEVRGTTKVWMFVNAEGRVSNVRIQASSGREALDRAARSVASHMEFDPATRGGEPIGVWVSRSLTFRPPELDPEDLHRNVGDGGRRELRLRADSIRLRGNASLELGDGGSPLVVVDGQRVDGESVLADLRPSEITSIEVLKGPSAVEAYGEEARDGVVRISTEAAAASGG